MILGFVLLPPKMGTAFKSGNMPNYSGRHVAPKKIMVIA
jgi:hypothetical protein